MLTKDERNKEYTHHAKYLGVVVSGDGYHFSDWSKTSCGIDSEGQIRTSALCFTTCPKCIRAIRTGKVKP